MQTSASFPFLNSGHTGAHPRASSIGSIPRPKSVRMPSTASKALAADSAQSAIRPKKRRQLTSQAPQLNNAFAKLGPLVASALKGNQ